MPPTPFCHTLSSLLPPLIICALHERRREIELFFKWMVKQNLRIKSFYGTSENAIESQTWAAIAVYVLAAIIKKEPDLRTSLVNYRDTVNDSRCVITPDLDHSVDHGMSA